MPEAISSPLEAWGNFYLIVGSSAGALTGLQFVVMTLITQTGPVRARGETISAFGTPNVVHFCAALLLSAILSAPWGTLWFAGLALSGCGLLGSFYAVVVIMRARRQRHYEPVFEDWLWHAMLPVLAYATLLIAGVTLERHPPEALFVIGAVALLLVFIGIHNAWDTVTYVTVAQAAAEQRAAAGAGEKTELPAGGGVEVGTEVEALRGSGPGSS